MKDIIIDKLKENTSLTIMEINDLLGLTSIEEYQSLENALDSLVSVYDYIRMLDADGYPHAFVEVGNLRFEFDRAALKDGFIEADVKISIRELKEG